MTTNALHNVYEAANAIGVDTSTEGTRERNQILIVDRISRAIYKGTDCGAYVAPQDGSTAAAVWGIVIGSIVEGCDFGTTTYPLAFPFTVSDFWARVEAVEAEAGALWSWANEGDADAAFVTLPPALEFIT
jgi:hypothetical protein